MDYSGITLSDLPKPPPGRRGWPWDDGTNLLGRKSVLSAPKIVVVTPSFNQAFFLEETIRSVILQGYSNLEYWVMDGGSSDNTKDILRRYSPWLAGWKSEPDRGQADAINKVWGSARGDFYGWINSDDLFNPGALYTLISYFKEHPDTGYVYGDLEIINQESQRVGLRKYQPFNFQRLVKEAGWISQPGSLISGKALEQVGLLNMELRLQMDLDLWLRTGLHYKFGYIPIPLARYRKHASTKTKTQQSRAAEEILYIYGKFFDTPGLPKEMSEIRSYAFANAHLYAAYRLLNSGDLPTALAQAGTAIKSNARIILSKRFWNFPKAIVVARLRSLRGDRP